MPAYSLTAAWLKIGSAGQAIEVQNLSAAAILITAGASPPTGSDGLLLAALDTRLFALTADLYARAAGGGPATVEVMGGFTLPGSTAVPFASAAPTIAGTPAVGQVLSSSQGTWTGAPTTYATQWSRAGTAIPGATASTYTPVQADVGTPLSVTVTATNPVGSATATSAATLAIAGLAPPIGTGTGPGGGATSLADFTDPNNAYLVALAA